MGKVVALLMIILSPNILAGDCQQKNELGKPYVGEPGGLIETKGYAEILASLALLKDKIGEYGTVRKGNSSYRNCLEYSPSSPCKVTIYDFANSEYSDATVIREFNILDINIEDIRLYSINLKHLGVYDLVFKTKGNTKSIKHHYIDPMLGMDDSSLVEGVDIRVPNEVAADEVRSIYKTIYQLCSSVN